MMEFFYGVCGLAGFESLRVYACLWAKRPIAPYTNLPLYLMTLLALGIFSGAVAYALAKGTVAAALFIGFSVPTNIKVALEAARNSSVAHDDDISLTKPTLARVALFWMHEYFKFS